VTARVVNDVSPVLASPVLRIPGARAQAWDPFRKPFKFPPSVPRCAVPVTRGPAPGAEHLARSIGRPVGRSSLARRCSYSAFPVQGYASLLLDGKFSQRPTTHGAHPSAPRWRDVHRGCPAGIPETACDLGRRVCGGVETAMVQQRSYLAGPWRARRSEGRRSTRRFRVRVWDHVGVPGQAGQPPHSRGVFFLFLLTHIPCDIETRGATPPPLRCVLFLIPKIPKRRGRRKTGSRRREGGPAGLGHRVAPAPALAADLSAGPPVGLSISPPSYTLRHRNAGSHAPAASRPYP
jgi:hypothetical protein